MGQNRFQKIGVLLISAALIQGCSPANLGTSTSSSSSSSQQSSQNWHANGSSCSINGRWKISMERAQSSGTCQPDNCGWGSNPSCSEITYADVAMDTAGNIEVRIYYPFIPSGHYAPENDPFVGTIDSNGDFTASYDDLNGNGSFQNSTLIGTFSESNCTLDVDFHWDPDTNCTSDIQLTGE